MKKVRVRVPVTIDVPDSALALLEAAAPLVRAAVEHAPALRELAAAGSTFAKEANRIVKTERAKKRALRPGRAR